MTDSSPIGSNRNRSLLGKFMRSVLAGMAVMTGVLAAPSTALAHETNSNRAGPHDPARVTCFPGRYNNTVASMSMVPNIARDPRYASQYVAYRFWIYSVEQRQWSSLDWVVVHLDQGSLLIPAESYVLPEYGTYYVWTEYAWHDGRLGWAYELTATHQYDYPGWGLSSHGGCQL